MIIQGRVAEILVPRTGTRSDNTEWKAQPFIVEYFEHETDMTPQSVMLETFDTNVIDNLKEEMIVRCVISLRAEHWTKDDRDGWTQRARLHQIKCVALPGKNKKSFMPEEAASMAAQHDNAPAAANVPTEEPSQEDMEDLPF